MRQIKAGPIVLGEYDPSEVGPSVDGYTISASVKNLDGIFVRVDGHGGTIEKANARFEMNLREVRPDWFNEPLTVDGAHIYQLRMCLGKADELQPPKVRDSFKPYYRANERY